MSTARTRRRAASGARRLTSWLLAAASAALLCMPRLGHADERRASSHRAQLVVVDYPNSAFTDPELHAAVRELLSRIQVRVVSMAQATEGEVIAYAHILVGTTEVNVTVEDARNQQPAASRSVPRGDSSALLRETLAHVLLGLIEPLAEARQPASAQALRDGGDGHRPHSPAPQLGVHCGPLQVARGYWSARFVGSGALVWERRVALALDASAALPVSIDEEGVKARALLAGARARGRVTPLAFTHVALDAALSVGADVFSVRPKSAVSGTRPGQTDRKVQPVLGVALGARARVHGHMELVLGFGVDLDPLPRRWVLEEGAMQAEIFATDSFRPYATLGLDWLPYALPVKPAGGATP